MARSDDGSDPVGDFVENSGLVDGMVTGWVLFVHFIDPETGQLHYFGDSMEGQGAVATLGMGDAIAAIERQRIVQHHFDDDD